MTLTEIEMVSRAVGVLDAISMCGTMQITAGLAALAGQTAEELGCRVQREIGEKYDEN